MRTLHYLTTASAAQKRAISAAWHKHNRLLSMLRQRGKALHQRPTNQLAMPRLKLLPHVHDRYLGRWFWSHGDSHDPALWQAEGLSL